MANPGQPTLYRREFCELAHNYWPAFLGETLDCTPWVRQQNPGQMVDHWSCR